MLKRLVLSVGMAIALASRSADAQATVRPQIAAISIVTADDSAANKMIPLSVLALPSQRPWQNQWFVEIDLAGVDSSNSASLEVVVGFDLRMGPVAYGGPDGEILLRDRIDSSGVWFRSSTTAKHQESCSVGCPVRVRVGPFDLESLIPGPTGADALLWPTRLRATAQVLTSSNIVQHRPASLSIRRSVLAREFCIR